MELPIEYAPRFRHEFLQVEKMHFRVFLAIVTAFELRVLLSRKASAQDTCAITDRAVKRILGNLLNKSLPYSLLYSFAFYFYALDAFQPALKNILNAIFAVGHCEVWLQ